MNDCTGGLYSIDREGPLPIYHQLKKIIKRDIEEGRIKPGERIPTEHELCDQFTISRAPVRQALTELANEGLLYRQRGSGTFVNHQAENPVISLRAIIAEDLWAPTLRKAVSLYNNQQNETRISLKVETSGRPQLRTKILSEVGEGRAPDIALIDWAWVSEFAELHFLKRLDVLDRDWAESFRSDLFPAFLDRSTPALYGIQPEANVSVIWYRKDWFKKEGQSPPQTWSELVAAAQVFKRYVDFPLVFAAGTKAGETTTYQLLPFIWAGGGCIFSYGKVALGHQVVITLDFLRSVVQNYRVAPPDVVSYTWDHPARLFGQGKAALAIGGSYEKPLIQEESGWNEQDFRKKVGCIPIPAGPGGKQATVSGGMVYVIFQQSKQAGTSLEILKKVVSPPLMQEFCTKTGRSPTRISVAQSLDAKDAWFSRQVSSLLHRARTRLNIPQYAAVSRQIQTMMENAISGRLPPSQAVEQARGIIDAIVSRGD